MGLVRLVLCVSGVYATFLLWAIAQERLSTPFPSSDRRTGTPHSYHYTSLDQFPSSVFLNYAQAVASSLSALVYLVVGSWRDGSWKRKGLGGVTGWKQFWSSSDSLAKSKGDSDNAGISNGHSRERKQPNGGFVEQKNPVVKQTPQGKALPFLLLQVAASQTFAGPVGFLSLRHISYPTMVLGKSCKLIPVMLLNLILYRRRFAMHKYVVVGLVTLGISLFMLFGSKKKKGGADSLWGLTLLLVNLMLDGMTNSTQDQIFTLFPSFTGQQMMLAMAVSTQLILLPLLLLPLPSNLSTILSILPFTSSSVPNHPITFSQPAFTQSIQFLLSHRSAIRPLLAYALLGGLGQLFIFETIQHFGSLTLVMITVTRKLFTMLLSVIIFNHSLTTGQWTGIAVVFSGIGLEAGIKRRDMMRRARRDRT
ncbi:UAA transporter family-domain-containing protein [Kockovaella imperatae]|uniref:UDP-galactose transporter homolog 1 n=1 Tax=Kockovaella imperatae TaxID=4999 RepID=A0A1Y1UAK6_9TREE|nr:UAA transporter family-domain-containing protein [Kockovaella imperatae]ORX35042.1 UAA transporter family-domain-containing protein [Kockovaella imperatae]